MAIGQNKSIKRRNFLGHVGRLTIGIPMGMSSVAFLSSSPTRDLPRSIQRHPNLDAWLEILANDRIRVFTGKVELGQGIGVVIQQVAAEELYVDLSKIEVVMADTDRTPNEGFTSGSGSVKGSAMAVRLAAATAREKLCELGAEKLKLSKAEVFLKNGSVHSVNEDRSVGLFELLRDQNLETEVRFPTKPIAKRDYQFVGKSISRPEINGIVRGEPYFIQDMRLPGTLAARILRPPTADGVLIACDESGFRATEHLAVEIVRDGNFLAVLGKTEYEVIQAIEKLANYTQWSDSKMATDEKQLRTDLPSMVRESETVVSKGTKLKGHPANSINFQASFFKPYILHSSLGTACGLAVYDGALLKVWSHSQGVYPLREALSSMLDLDPSKIRVIGVPGAGCFGHNCSDDAAADAAVIALKKPGVPIKVSWSREQEHQWEAAGSAMRIDIQSHLSKKGKILYWKSDVYSDSHSTRPNKDPGTLLTARQVSNAVQMQGRGYLRGGHRNADPYYEIETKHIDAHYFEGPIRVSSLRSLGAFANVFAIETIMDEMRTALGVDPILFRINHLSDARAIAVLERISEMAKSAPLAPTTGLGYAFSRYKNNDGYCAVAAQVKMRADGSIQILKMWAAVDVGEVMNPEGMAQQVEGAILQAASWTLIEEVKFKNGICRSDNYHSYRTLKMKDMTDIEVSIMDRPHEPPLGGGELATAPTPAAITNAIFQVTGKRIYDLPVGKIS